MDIREVSREEIEQVSQFLERTMTAVFPFPLSVNSLRDLTEMESLFLINDSATFLAAFNNGEVVGTIAVRPYDGRIVALENRYDLSKTCEIVKCYVGEQVRQQGIGSELFLHAESYSRKTGYETLYLHTHKFLPGGLPFWQKKGFQITIDEGDSFQTVHLEKVL